MTEPLESINNAGFSAYLHGFSAIDSWLGREYAESGKHRKKEPLPSSIQILTNAGTADLAKLFENLRYPGANLADAALDFNGCTFYFRCADSHDKKQYFPINENKSKTTRSSFYKDHRASFSLLEFYRDCETLTFYDPNGIYPALKEIRRGLYSKQKTDACFSSLPMEVLKNGLNANSGRGQALMDAAMILAKYFPVDSEAELTSLINGLCEDAAARQEEQRFLLSTLMTSANPAAGMEILKNCGFIDEYWKELAILDEAEQAKEFHPEGNAWKHTMETFRYRKSGDRDLRLSLGLLLHDTGKPLAMSNGSRHFDSHAELGEIQARKFLGRLGFDASLINDVCFLVRHHMLTAALHRLPLFRTEEIMASDLFPLLLELYRCDESSSFKGLDGYYESSAAYQSYLRNRRNPYRSADGRKLNRRQMLEPAKR